MPRLTVTRSLWRDSAPSADRDRLDEPMRQPIEIGLTMSAQMTTTAIAINAPATM